MGASIVTLLLVLIPLLENVHAQDTGKPPEQGAQENKPSNAGETLARGVSDAAKAPVEFFNLMDKRSLFFPDIAASTKPISPGQKFELFVDNSISFHTILYSAMGSAIGQAENSPTGFGEGWDAYGKRFGSSMARQASGEFFGTFMLASALHEDPRFFPEKDPSFGGAVKYSVKRLFVMRNDSGQDVANISGLVGPLLGEGLANAYWPDRNRTAGDTLMRYGIDLATRAGGNFLREYWPVFYKKLSHSNSSAGARQ